jgi:glycosyltransferase involved in cell wall biosynthesis
VARASRRRSVERALLTGSGVIAFAIDGALAQRTGGYLYDQLVIERLRARGLGVDVIELRTSSRDLVAENVRLARCAASFRRDDVLIIDELSHPRALLAALTPRRCKLVTLVHHLAASERTGLARRARLAIERPLLRASDRVIVTSETTAHVLAAIGVSAAKLRVALPGRDRLGERATSPSRAERLRVLFLGTVTPRKGALELAHALSRSPNVEATFAGSLTRDVVYAARVQRVLQPLGARARVLGEVDDERARGLFDTHDLLALPSHYEGYGIVLAEAVAHGLGVVATTAGAIGEVVRDGLEARLVAPRDVDALTRILQQLERDRDEVAGMQRHALERAAMIPTWDETAERFAEALT